MKRWGFIVVLLGALAISSPSFSTRSWAAPGMDSLRQTVPTMTPTSPPGTPSAPTPTREGGPGQTPVPPQPTPTATSTATPMATLSPTPEVPPAGTPPPVLSPTGSPVSLTAMPAHDFGDAPDPAFPSLLASDGARHSILEFEWLGEGVDQEQDSRQVDNDLYDDAVEIGELMTCTQANLQVTVTVRNRDDPQHPYDAEHPLYLNVLVDWDADGSWAGRVACPQGLVASEWALRNLPVDVSSWAEGITFAVLSLGLPVGPHTGNVWARFTLSYGEVVAGDAWDGRGAFTFGETEDHLLTISLSPAATPHAVAAVTPTSLPPIQLPAETSWGQSLLCFAVGLLLGIALVTLWAARRRRDWRLLVLGLLFTVVMLLLGLLYWGPRFASPPLTLSRASPTMQPTPHERLVPTTIATQQPEPGGASPTPHSVTPTPELNTAPSGTGAIIATPLPSFMAVRDRFGFGEARAPIDRFAAGQLRAGWYYAWRADPNPERPEGMEFAQMIQVRGTSFFPSGQDLERVVRDNPGSLWLIGNEPDVMWQDNAAPTDYAQVYHEAYAFLKERDPACQVAIAGVSQATPLRLQYLDMILEAYRDLYGEMIPVDVWNVHGYILREERGSWGVDIPAGISVDEGRLYEIDDHDNMEIFSEQIVAFRRWMRDKGERDKPLIVSEYGVVMPADYGFRYERVRDFMYATFDYFLTASDVSLGYPADGNRLVQRWAWYSLSDTVYPTGNLFDPDTGQITPLGLAYSSYTSSY